MKVGSLPRIRPSIVVSALAVVATASWVLFHPEIDVDAAAIPPAVRAELAKAGFRSTSGVAKASFKSVRSFDGTADTLAVEQKITRIDEVLTEKRSRRRANLYYEENVGLYVGPITVVRYSRSVLPVVAAFLPGQLWASTRMSEFAVQHVDEHFPRRTGSNLVARVIFEERDADGQLVQTERVQLRCEVRDVVSAASLDMRLAGLASAITCEERTEPNGRLIAAGARNSVVIENAKYLHLYLDDVGWSVPVEGERTMRLGQVTAKETWRSELKSFTASTIAR